MIYFIKKSALDSLNQNFFVIKTAIFNFFLIWHYNEKNSINNTVDSHGFHCLILQYF